MNDIVSVLLIISFLLISLGYIELCAKLRGKE